MNLWGLRVSYMGLQSVHFLLFGRLLMLCEVMLQEQTRHSIPLAQV